MTDPDLFQAFHRWLYVGQLISSDEYVETQIPHPTLCRLWALGQHLGAPLFCNHVIGAFMRDYKVEVALQISSISYDYLRHTGLL